jgi:hypothetical protein
VHCGGIWKALQQGNLAYNNEEASSQQQIRMPFRARQDKTWKQDKDCQVRMTDEQKSIAASDRTSGRKRRQPGFSQAGTPDKRGRSPQQQATALQDVRGDEKRLI